ncbi:MULTISPECIES: hypothetical protein [Corynebacterium]|uniref:hypothetical protein n=1 Tax=Corynebacterium TaxID=1716 RepID=UPI000A677241|nr:MULTISPECIES: hypothetical protein [Corynebacterium]MCX2164231.1 hypothetical protein [Corynebacterium auriscanis]
MDKEVGEPSGVESGGEAGDEESAGENEEEEEASCAECRPMGTNQTTHCTQMKTFPIV